MDLFRANLHARKTEDHYNARLFWGETAHWVLPWSRYEKVLFDFLVTDFVLLL